MEKYFFNIEKESVIWLYGAGYRGEQICKSLIAQEYKVEAFIDQKASEIRFFADREVLPVEVALKKIQTEDVLVLCLQNALQQELVATQFAAGGICKILYLPMEKNMPLETRAIYRQKYFSLLSGECALLKQIPCFHLTEEFGRSVIRRTDTMTLFWCDVSLIHSSLFHLEKEKAQCKETREMLDAYADVPMEKLIPYKMLFRYLSGEKVSYAEYMLLQERLSEVAQDKLIEDRKLLFEIYEDSFLYDFSFFTDAPPVVEWNSKGYFNVCDGMHRIQYLMFKGYSKVPVATRHRDYKESFV